MKYRAVVVRTRQDNQHIIVEASSRKEARDLAIGKAHSESWPNDTPSSYSCDELWEEEIQIPEDIRAKINKSPDALTDDSDASIALDDLVHDLKGREASSINNEGTQGQIQYLRESGVSWNEIREALGLPEVKGGK